MVQQQIIPQSNFHSTDFISNSIQNEFKPTIVNHAARVPIAVRHNVPIVIQPPKYAPVHIQPREKQPQELTKAQHASL